MAPTDPRQLLERDLNSHERKLNGRYLDVLVEAHAAGAAIGGEVGTPALGLTAFLKHEVAREQAQVYGLRRRQDEFQKRMAQAASASERREHLVECARDLGAGGKQLRGDRQACQRWFDEEAMRDRFLRLQSAGERKMAFCLQRLGVVAALVLGEEPTPAAQKVLWQNLGLEKVVKPLLGHEGDARVGTAAFRCLAFALRALDPSIQEQAVAEDTLAYIYRASLDARQNVWMQCEALELLQSLSAAALTRVLRARLGRPESGDDLFVRRHAVAVLGRHLTRLPELADLVTIVANDPSPFVRQALTRAVASAPAELARVRLRALARADAAPQVRAAAVLESLAWLQRPELADDFFDLLLEIMAQEADSFVLRVAIHVAGVGLESQAAAGALGADRQHQVCDGLNRLQSGADSFAVRRWAAQARERIWCATFPAARALKQLLQEQLRGLAPGRSRRLPRRLLRDYDETCIGRVLAVLAQEDFGFDLERRWWGDRITRGHVFRFRLWRLLHELRHPSPDKRQAFPHTIGRVSYAQLRAPSGILCELEETKVPGEPLYLPEEAGWRPYLPLLDDVLSSLNQFFVVTPVRFHTSDGVTELTPPRSLWRRGWAYLRIVTGFAALARLRNWHETEQAAPDDYAQALSRLGFRLTFRGYEAPTETPADASVTRFFPAVVPLFAFDPGAWLREFLDAFWHYFTSVFENSVTELMLFVAVVFALFCARHAYATFALRRVRRQLPFVCGGWGTRGKSGTERLKAALFNALGFNVVSKTTGCEAMFLHAYPYDSLRELFLFRSFDKATIWEQAQMVHLAGRLGAEVFLWECMGLQPAYVRLLQRQWMNDDLATITNTYPDHEDIQGPAGIDIPRVMTDFIPPRSRLLTSEEHMRPILKEAADRLHTSCAAVGWLEAGLLTPDILQRFPYEEHPYNVALVLALAAELGIDRDFALKEMADRVVPDLGALKTYPTASLRSRRLEFTNGMSANERHGCLGNWTRLGFDRHDPETDPGTWICTVVNNRADRIPRSQVFAAILVNDLQADRHFLIGDNLSGLRGYLHAAWNDWARTITLWPAHAADPRQAAQQVWQSMARRLRLPTRPEHVQARLRVMLEAFPARDASSRDALVALWDDPARLRERLQAEGLDARLVDALISHLSLDREASADYAAFSARIDAAEPGQHVELDRAFHALLKKWFDRKFVVIEDYYASGDEIVARLAAETPPGFRNRVMGIQNIKGTGLDFVYRWEAWLACHRASELLRGDDPVHVKRGLKELAEFTDYGLLCEEHVQQTIAQVKHSPLAQREEHQALLQVIQQNLETQLSAIRERLERGPRGGGWSNALFAVIEAFLDAGAAVSRRKTADQIYRDLADLRISHDRAARELQALTKQQKGGWLRDRLASLLRFFMPARM